MTKINQNITMYSGNTRLLVFPTVDMGVPANLTGATIIWVLKRFNSDEKALVTKTLGNGISKTVSAYTVRLEKADTLGFMGGRYYHETQVTDASGDVTTGAIGYITIKKSGIFT